MSRFPLRLLFLLTLLSFSSFLLAGCGAAGDEILLGAPPWQDGEVSEYAILNAQDDMVGTAVWAWHVAPEGWQQT